MRSHVVNARRRGIPLARELADTLTVRRRAYSGGQWTGGYANVATGVPCLQRMWTGGSFFSEDTERQEDRVILRLRERDILDTDEIIYLEETFRIESIRHIVPRMWMELILTRLD